MEMKPYILQGKVMHKRFFPRENSFVYGIYYLAFPLSKMVELANGWRFGVNRFAIASFHEKDHGERSDAPVEPWARRILAQKAPAATGEIILVAMPRVFGYVFNPVSFWLCHDVAGKVRAVICEVNNTFGEQHCYLCTREDGGIITENDCLEAKKVFHVSPFLKREGSYKFRFDIQSGKMGVWIDYYAADGNKQLVTSLTGKLIPYTASSFRRVFWRHPLVCLAAVGRIHMQALRLAIKGIKYVPKPAQLKGGFN
jgi:DUF1365 family protein